jgi:hypothetical protein
MHISAQPKDSTAARAARLVAYFDSLRAAEKEGTRPPLMGFFAAAFQHYPADIDKIIPESISPQMSGLLAVSLRLAGQQAKAQSGVATLKSKNDEAPDLARRVGRHQTVRQRRTYAEESTTAK